MYHNSAQILHTFKYFKYRGDAESTASLGEFQFKAVAQQSVATDSAV